MFRHLLVPIDGTPESESVLALVELVAGTLAADVTLVRVVTAGGGDPATQQDADASATAYVSEQARKLQDAGVRAGTMVARGSPAGAIVDQAKRLGADLIVMATHGRGGLERMVLGSVAEGVLTQSHVPVLLSRPGSVVPPRLSSLLVPVDGSPGGSLAVGTAIGLAKAVSATIVLLEAVAPIPALGYELPDGSAAYVDPRWDEDARDSAQGYVDQLATRVRAEGVEARGIATLGLVVDTIRETASAEHSSLIVMSTHALTGPARAVLGSVADAVVRTSAHPVLLVRYRAADKQP